MTTQPESTKDPTSDLRVLLRNLMIRGSRTAYDGDPINHPLVTLNAIKNILADDRSGKHAELLDILEKWLRTFPISTENDDIIEKVKKSATGTPVFISDLTAAIQDGNRKKAEELAAQIHLSALNPTLIQECMSAIFLQDTARFGAFCYHWLRVNHFVAGDDQIWNISAAGFPFLGNPILPGPAVSSDLPDTQDLMRKILVSGSREDLITFTAVLRLIDHDYLRSPVFRIEVARWMNSVNPGDRPAAIPQQLIRDLKDYLENGSSLFVKLLAGSLNMVHHAPGYIAELEALRTCARMADEESLKAVAVRLMNWING